MLQFANFFQELILPISPFVGLKGPLGVAVGKFLYPTINILNVYWKGWQVKGLMDSKQSIENNNKMISKSASTVKIFFVR